jgi:Flp pilus assembly pilin Flp
MLPLWVKTQNKMQTDQGATLVEYALLLVLIAVVAIVIITQVGENASGAFSNANEGLD